MSSVTPPSFVLPRAMTDAKPDCAVVDVFVYEKKTTPFVAKFGCSAIPRRPASFAVAFTRRCRSANVLFVPFVAASRT